MTEPERDDDRKRPERAGAPSRAEDGAEPGAAPESTAPAGPGPDTDVVPAPEAAPDEAPEEAPSLPAQEVRAILEALIFASPQPVTSREVSRVLAGVEKEAWTAALEELKADYARDGRGLQLVEVAGGFQVTTRPEYNDWVRELLDPRAPTRLSIQALETLAVIAYKQPVTLPEVIELRGVKSGGVLKTLLEKRLIRITGRKEVVGRPMLYGTTKQFLLHFGLKDLGDLPKVEEFAEVLGEEVDVAGLKKAIDAPRPVEVPLGEEVDTTEPEADSDPRAQSDRAGPESTAELPAPRSQNARPAPPQEGGDRAGEGTSESVPDDAKDDGADA